MGNDPLYDRTSGNLFFMKPNYFFMEKYRLIEKVCQSFEEFLIEIINDLLNIGERLEKIEQDIENPNNLLVIGAPIRLLTNLLDVLNKFRETHVTYHSISVGCSPT